MKTYFFILFLFVSSFGFAQNNHIVKTDDGRRVLLKADFTWEYIDALKGENTPTVQKRTLGPSLKSSCANNSDFKEPRLNSKIQAQLRKGRATIKHIKNKVAKDYNCDIDQVQLLTASETKQNGVYEFCANGKKTKYKRVGHAIIKPLF